MNQQDIHTIQGIENLETILNTAHPLIVESLTTPDAKRRKQIENQIEREGIATYLKFIQIIASLKGDKIAFYKSIFAVTKKEWTEGEDWAMLYMNDAQKKLIKIIKKTLQTEKSFRGVYADELVLFVENLESYNASNILHEINNEMPSFILNLEIELSELKKTTTEPKRYLLLEQLKAGADNDIFGRDGGYAVMKRILQTQTEIKD